MVRRLNYLTFRPLGWLLPAAMLLAVGGCQQTCPTRLLPLDVILARHNANAAAVPHLWARARIAISMSNSKGQSFSWGSTSPLSAPNGVLLLFKGEETSKTGPSDFVLIGKEVSQELFRLGNNNEAGQYYLSYRFGEHSGLWWGRTALAGAPGADALPIDPLQLLAVLNVCELPTDLRQPPAVAVTMSNNPCAYVLTYLDRQPVTGRILFRREIYLRWSDTEPPRAFRINFFDSVGRRIMTADLANYQPIDTAGAPIMPTDIDVTWFDADHIRPFSNEYQVKGRLSLSLSEMTIKSKGLRSATAPPEAGTFPADRVVQVDKDVPAGGGKS